MFEITSPFLVMFIGPLSPEQFPLPTLINLKIGKLFNPKRSEKSRRTLSMQAQEKLLVVSLDADGSRCQNVTLRDR